MIKLLSKIATRDNKDTHTKIKEPICLRAFLVLEIELIFEV